MTRRTPARKRSLRTLTRVASAIFLTGVAFTPVAWERLPTFGLVYIPDPDGPDSTVPKPDDGIDVSGAPEPGLIIRPTSPYPSSSSALYAFFDSFQQTPPRISTCTPMKFVIRSAFGPAEAADFVFEAVQRLSNATGVTFEFKGFTEDVFAFNRPSTLFPWEADEAELWIGWATADEVPELGPTSNDEPFAVGVGGPQFSGGTDDITIVGGGVVLRSGMPYPLAFGDGVNWGNVLLHELAHAFGLDHVEATSELMYPSLQETGPDGFHDGDLAGLQAIREACP